MTVLKRSVKSLIDLAFPAQCLACGVAVEDEQGLCGSCWKDVPLLRGVVCDSCGVPLPGPADGTALICDDCMSVARGWSRGRAALIYSGVARKLVLQLKHGDRLDLVAPMSQWMAAVATPLIDDDTVIVPVPLHRARLFRRRYNQAALLAQALAGHLGRRFCPDALERSRATHPQEGMGRQARFDNQAGAISVAAGRQGDLKEKSVLLVDDVMTSGATFAAATEACYEAGARQVNVLALARVVKEPYV